MLNAYQINTAPVNGGVAVATATEPAGELVRVRRSGALGSGALNVVALNATTYSVTESSDPGTVTPDYVDDVTDSAQAAAGYLTATAALSADLIDSTNVDAQLVEGSAGRAVDLTDEFRASASLVTGRVGRHTTLTDSVSGEAAWLTAVRGQFTTLTDDAHAEAEIIKAGGEVSDTLTDSAGVSGVLLRGSRGQYITLTDAAQGSAALLLGMHHAVALLDSSVNALGDVLDEQFTYRTKDDITDGFYAVDTAYQSAVARDLVEARAVAESELVGNASGEAWVFNTRTLAMSRYAGFDANQMTAIDGRVLTAGNRGLQTFAPSRAVRGTIRLGLTDFASPQLKSLRVGYLTAAGGSTVRMIVRHGTGEAMQATEYAPVVDSSVVPRTYRINFSRKAVGTYWGFELVAPAGERTTLLGLNVLPVITSRRV